MQTPISVSNPKTSKRPLLPPAPYAPSPSGRPSSLPPPPCSRAKREHNAGIKRHEIKMPFGEKDGRASELAGDLKGKYRFGAEEGGLERPFKPGLQIAPVPCIL